MGMIMLPVSTLRSIAIVFLFMLGLLTPLSAQSPDDMRRDFEAVQKLNTRDAYEAFLKQYPEGLYAGLAREELKKLDAEAHVRLIRALNFELARVGCAPNAGGDEWTSESQMALLQFSTHANKRLDLNKASLEALEAVREKMARVCPLVCGPNERLQGDSCVAGLFPFNGRYAGEVELLRAEGHQQSLAQTCIVGRKFQILVVVDGKTIRGISRNAAFTSQLTSDGAFSGSYDARFERPDGKQVATVRRFSGKVDGSSLDGEFAAIGPGGTCFGKITALRLEPGAPLPPGLNELLDDKPLPPPAKQTTPPPSKQQQKEQKKAEPKGATWCIAMVGAVGQQRCGFASEAQCLAAKVDPRARCFRAGS